MLDMIVFVHVACEGGLQTTANTKESTNFTTLQSFMAVSLTTLEISRAMIMMMFQPSVPFAMMVVTCSCISTFHLISLASSVL